MIIKDKANMKAWKWHQQGNAKLLFTRKETVFLSLFCNLIQYHHLKSVLCECLSPKDHSILCIRVKCQRGAWQSIKTRALFNPQWLSAACANKEHRPWLVGRCSPSWRLATSKHFSGLTGSPISPWTSAHLKHLEISVFSNIYTCLIWNISLCGTITGVQNSKLNVPGESN